MRALCAVMLAMCVKFLTPSALASEPAPRRPFPLVDTGTKAITELF